MLENWSQWVIPASSIVGGFLLGLILDRIVLARIQHLAERAGWHAGATVARALRGMIILWLTIAGAYGAVLAIPMSETLSDVLQKSLLVVLILTITFALSRLAVSLIALYNKERGDQQAVTIFNNLARLAVFAIGALIVLQAIGVPISPLLTALGVGGLAVALALQETLTNLFAGLYVLASRHIRPGDWIQLETGEQGQVTDITWRNTTVATLASNRVIIPNARLSSSVVTNFNEPSRQLAVPVQLGVGYTSDLEHVEKVTQDVAQQVMREVPGGVPNHTPTVRYDEFGPSTVNLTVYLRAQKYPDQFLVKHEFMKRIYKRYAEEGIDMPFPTYTLYVQGKEQGGPG